MGIRIGNRCCGRNYFIDSITGVIPTTSCPAICGTVASFGELPDPPEGCEFILARVVDESSFLVTLYEWHEGEGWHFHTDVNGNIYPNGTIDSFDYDAIDGWSVIVNGETYSGNGNALLDSPVYSLDVTFISNSGCSYTIETIGEEPCY
jgi:hypothetical protein